MSASQGRRRTVSPVLAMVHANSADMPTTLTPKKVGPPPPSSRVTQAARYMKTPVSTGYSSTCWPGPGSRRYGNAPSASPRAEYRIGMSE